MVELYRYADPVRYLSDAYTEKKLRNPRFSLRAWATALGLREPTPLSQILRGKRPIPDHYLPKLGRFLKLRESEYDYFVAIVNSRYSRDPAQREFWAKRALGLGKKANLPVHTLEEFEPFRDPVTLAVHELVAHANFAPDPLWIRARLRSKPSVARIAKALENLRKHGLVVADATGKWERARPLVSSTFDVSSLWIKNFHESSLKLAASEIYRQPLDEREYGSYVLSVRRSELPRMKRSLREFTRAFLAEYDHATGADEVYQINLNFLALTENPRTENRK